MLLNCIAILDTKYLMLGKKAPCNGRSLDLYKRFDFQPITYLFVWFSFSYNVINVGR